MNDLPDQATHSSLLSVGELSGIEDPLHTNLSALLTILIGLLHTAFKIIHQILSVHEGKKTRS